MRFAFSLFGREIFAVDLMRAILVQTEDTEDDEPKGIKSGSGGQFETPFGFRPPEWFPNEYGQDPHHTSG